MELRFNFSTRVETSIRGIKITCFIIIKKDLYFMELNILFDTIYLTKLSPIKWKVNFGVVVSINIEICKVIKFNWSCTDLHMRMLNNSMHMCSLEILIMLIKYHREKKQLFFLCQRREISYKNIGKNTRLRRKFSYKINTEKTISL